MRRLPETMALALTLVVCGATGPAQGGQASNPQQTSAAQASNPRPTSPALASNPQPTSTAQASDSRPPAHGSGSRWSGFFAYGFNQVVFNSAPGIDIVSAGIRWSYLWDEKGSGLFRGQPGFGIEVVPLMGFLEADRTAWALGANLLYEHHFAAAGAVRPIWRIGAGFLYASEAVPARVTQHNFSLLTDLGLDFRLNARSALFAGYRFHHVSNANTGDFNPGINVHSIIVGLSLFR